MPYPSKTAPGLTRLERELARERQQHAANRESKTGMNASESERIKDARENYQSAKPRR